MRKYFILCTFLFTTSLALAQKQVQPLKPTRLGIFKNGTVFVKREAMVKVTEKSFFINAPDKVLMGSYWVFVGKESSINSIVVKADTFKVSNRPKYLSDFFETSVGQQVTLYRNWDNSETKKLNGKLLDFLTQELNREANTITSKTSNMIVKENALQIKSDIEKIREQVQNIE